MSGSSEDESIGPGRVALALFEAMYSPASWPSFAAAVDESCRATTRA
ncbi:MAG: hypothetical protein WKF43_16810 [Acidimicrobiales bacterium]